MSVTFSIVMGYELNPVHDPDALFKACAIAGIPKSEVMIGMVSRGSDQKLCLMSETTKRLPKVGKGKKVEKTVSIRPPKGRILELASRYAAIPAAFYDKIESDYSPLDD